MATLREAMNRLIEDNMAESSTQEREMMLAVDVLTNEDAYEIMAFLPGLEADELSVEVLDNTVSLRGEFKNTINEDAKYLVSELPAGRFSRVITLPTALEPGKAEASMKNGFLRLWVPKAEAHRPKTIKVNMN
jgi:HSP20 family protein